MPRGCLRFATVILTGLLAVCAWADDDPEWWTPPAPRQHRPNAYFPSETPIFQPPDINTVFEQDTYREPDFLPPEAYEDEDNPPQRFGPAAGGGQRFQMAQYPFEDSAARDEDPQGHYAEPRWNPIPLPVAPPNPPPQGWRGWTWKDHGLTTTVLPAVDGNLGMTSLDLRTTFYPINLPILLFSPRFSWHLLDGPDSTDVPPQLYDMAIDATLFLPLGDRWSVLAAAGPAMFSDFRNTSSDAFRVTGKALAFYQWSPRMKLAAGFLYLGRQDVTALPAGGFIYAPNDRTKIEAMFPKPKYAYRLHQDGVRESWCYLSGEFGGNSWAVERADGENDILTLRDLRLIAGYERINNNSYRWLVEGGFVFYRKIEYASGNGTSNQSPTGMIRGGLVF